VKATSFENHHGAGIPQSGAHAASKRAGRRWPRRPRRATSRRPAEVLGRGADGKRPSHLQRAFTLKTSLAVQSAAWTPSPICGRATRAVRGRRRGAPAAAVPALVNHRP
jgi:hypothetical protein